MCVEVLDEHRHTRCGHVYTARMSVRFCFNAPPGSDDPCGNSTTEVRNSTDITGMRCTFCNPGQLTLCVPSSIMNALESAYPPNVVPALPPSAFSVPAVALAAAALQLPADNAGAVPTDTTGKSEQSVETEVNFGDFLNDSSEDGDKADSPVPGITYDEALQSVLAEIIDGDGDDYDFSLPVTAVTNDEALQSVLAEVIDGDGDDFDFDLPNTDNQPAADGHVSDHSVAADNGQQVYDSELDAEGETDPDYQAPAATTAAGDDTSDVSMPDAPSSSFDESTSEGSPDVGSLYEDSDESEAQAHAAMMVANRPMNRPATAAAVRAQARAQALAKAKGKGKLMASTTKMPPTKVTKRKKTTVNPGSSARDNAAGASTSKDPAADADADDEASITSSNDENA